MSWGDHNHDERPEFDPDGDTAGSILASLAMVFLLAGVVIIAKENCWIQMPTFPVNGGTHGSPTLIEE